MPGDNMRARSFKIYTASLGTSI